MFGQPVAHLHAKHARLSATKEGVLHAERGRGERGERAAGLNMDPGPVTCDSKSPWVTRGGIPAKSPEAGLERGQSAPFLGVAELSSVGTCKHRSQQRARLRIICALDSNFRDCLMGDDEMPPLCGSKAMAVSPPAAHEAQMGTDTRERAGETSPWGEHGVSWGECRAAHRRIRWIGDGTYPRSTHRTRRP